MINIELYILFLFTTLIITISPGPSTLLVASISFSGNKSKVLATILGDIFANIIQISVITYGINSLSEIVQKLLLVLQIAGLIYLFYLGASKLIRRSYVFSKSGSNINFLTGFWVSLSNPLAILFFVSLFLPFVDENLPKLNQVIIMGLTFISLDFMCLSLYGFAGNIIKRELIDKGKIVIINVISGFLLIICSILISLKFII